MMLGWAWLCLQKHQLKVVKPLKCAGHASIFRVRLKLRRFFHLSRQHAADLVFSFAVFSCIFLMEDLFQVRPMTMILSPLLPRHMTDVFLVFISTCDQVKTAKCNSSAR